MPNLPAVRAQAFTSPHLICRFIVLRRPVTSSSCGLLVTVRERCTNNENPRSY